MVARLADGQAVIVPAVRLDGKDVSVVAYVTGGKTVMMVAA